MSHDPCNYKLWGDQIYCGPRAFSEVEIRNTRKYLKRLDPVPILANDIHAYGNVVLTPYGYEEDKYPPNIDEIVSIF